MIVREQFTIRPYQPGDLQSISDVYNAAFAAVDDPRRVSPSDMQMYIEAPDFDAANDTFIVEQNGRVIAYGDLDLNVAAGRCWAEGAVLPEYQGQGIGSQLIRLSEARALKRAQVEIPPERPLYIQRFSIDSNPAALRLFEQNAYHYVRTFYRMLTDLDAPVDVPPLPEGIVLRPFDPVVDARVVYETHQEAFADHWDFAPNSYEEWTHYVLNRPDNGASMWLTAYDGDQIAGVCINRPYGDEDPQLAWVGTLAVRRPWRKRGLGLALLKRSFALFQERGFARAGLGVDASSLTNAVALYERAGMRVVMRTLAYRKTLRGAAPEAAG